MDTSAAETLGYSCPRLPPPSTGIHRTSRGTTGLATDDEEVLQESSAAMARSDAASTEARHKVHVRGIRTAAHLLPPKAVHGKLRRLHQHPGSLAATHTEARVASKASCGI